MLFSDLFKLHDDNFLQELEQSNKQYRAFRHHYQDDINILKERQPGFTEQEIDEKELLSTIGPIDYASKLAAIRTNPIVAEIACAEQGNPELDGKAVCFSFARMENNKAEFVGAFEMKRKVDREFFLAKYAAHLSDLPALLQKEWGFQKYVTKLGYSKQIKQGHHYYELELLDNPINEYRNRAVVHWHAPMAWSQKNLNHRIEEIRAPGFVRDFPGYYNVLLDFAELKAIMDNPLGNPEWKSKLTAVTGIYLIMDTTDGALYVGSAYSKDGGIWNRWSCYANNGHGGNVGLEAAIRRNPDILLKFRFSILRVMESSARARDVIEAESVLKQKLGSRVWGYNKN